MAFRSICVSCQNEEEDNVGSLDGYVVDKSDENWKNYLKSEVSESLQLFLITVIESSPLEKIAIIKNASVDDGERGKGLGNDLMSQFFDKIDAELVILMADTVQEQEEGFNLVKWYEGFGFEALEAGLATTCMVYDEYGILSKDVNKTLKEDYLNHLNSNNVPTVISKNKI